jgi:hypothetical protein
MKRAVKTTVLIISLLLLALTALARSGSEPSVSVGPGYDLSWWTVDGGGVTFSTGAAAATPGGTGYALSGTAGQPDAGLLTSGGEPDGSGTGYALGGGFWGVGALAIEHDIYLPLIVRDYRGQAPYSRS